MRRVSFRWLPGDRLRTVLEGLPIVACTAFHPEWDLSGKRLQRLGHGDALFELITLTVTAFQGQTVAVLGWIGDVDGPAGKLAKSFADIVDDRKADALLRLLFVHTDNLFLRPSWWEGLERDDQERLVRQVMTGTHMKARAAGDLAEDGRRLLTSDVIEMHTG